jgi:hypothetical protein
MLSAARTERGRVAMQSSAVIKPMRYDRKTIETSFCN